MKFMKFGKALLIGALSAGVVLGVTSCIEDYTVGYLYVTGTVTAQPSGNGIVSGFKIGHNTGKLEAINGLPVSSGGANPVRAILASGGRFLYVLNRGTTASGSANCTTADPCQNDNITQFAVGGNGILTAQQTFNTQGTNPFRIAVDSSGSFLLVLDHDAPDNFAATYNAATNACTLALGTGVKTCGDITVFKIDQGTGRLSLVQNNLVTQSSGKQINYFPIPANPVDFVLPSTSLVLTLTASSTQTSYPYTGGSSVFPFSFANTTGQLTIGLSGAQPLGISAGTAIVETANSLYVLDNEAPNPNPNGSVSQIVPYTVGTGGALQSQTSGAVAIDPTLANPISLILVSSANNEYLYVANQGNNITGQNAASGIAGYFLTNSPFQLTPLSPTTYGSGAGPQCIVEDPSKQFLFEANQFDSSITGRVLEPKSGQLTGMRIGSYSLKGPATWCLMDGRTN